MTLTIADIKPYLLFECISGSRAYGLATETSDTDIKGVYYLPKELYYGLSYIPQVNNETNDEVYYELGRFIELLIASNPNMLELLNSPQQTILFKHPIMNQLNPSWFLSKTCITTFANYALGQIKKARGLNKKIVNPIEKERKSILDFCFILNGVETIPLLSWLTTNNWQQQNIGLASVTHARDLYAVYYDEQATHNFQGIVKKDTANEVLLSSIPKSIPLQAYLSFNKDGYSAYCKKYNSYWHWVENRNENRYQQNVDHGRDYDSKNMMHTFRLLFMALDIAQTGQVKVWRDNREQLLEIKQGKLTYDELLYWSQQLMSQIEQAISNSNLPDTVNKKTALDTLVEMRKALYQ